MLVELISDKARSLGLTTLKRTGGLLTRFVPLPQPTLLVSRLMTGLPAAPAGLDALTHAILLAPVLRFMLPAVMPRLADLATRAGLATAQQSPATSADRFIDAVQALNRQLRIPKVLPDLRTRDIGELARAACAEADDDYPVARHMSRQHCEGLLKEIMPPSPQARHSAGITRGR